MNEPTGVFAASVERVGERERGRERERERERNYMIILIIHCHFPVAQVHTVSAMQLSDLKWNVSPSQQLWP
jgi:hypothetical protein